MQRFGIRVLSVLLSVGGVVGIGIALFMAYRLVAQHWLYGVLSLLFAALFVYATYVGIQLWRFRTGSWKRALILFLAQIPVFTLPGITYEWYTGISFKLMGGKVDKSTVLELGSSFNFYLDTRITDIAYGVNVVAILAVVVLCLVRSNPSFQRTASGGR